MDALMSIPAVVTVMVTGVVIFTVVYIRGRIEDVIRK